MNRLSVGILSAAALAGLLGSTAAYARSSAGTDAPAGVSPSGGAAQEQSTQVARPDARARWAPCAKPAHLEHRVCVTHVVRTVVVPDPATPTAAASGAPAGKPSAAAAKPSGAATAKPSAAPTRSPSGTATGSGAPGDHSTGEPGEDPLEPGDDGAGGAMAPRTH